MYITIGSSGTYIDILYTQFGVVPKSTGLVLVKCDIINKVRTRSDWTSIDKGLELLKDVFAIEEDAVEVKCRRTPHGRIGLTFIHKISCILSGRRSTYQVVFHGDTEGLTLLCQDGRARVLAIGDNST